MNKEIVEIIKISNLKLILVSALLAILLSGSYYFPILLSGLVIFYTLYFYTDKIIIVPFSIIILLTSTSTIFPEVRQYVLFSIYSLLLFFLIKQYGFEFSTYPKVPSLIKQFIAALFTALLLSTFYHLNLFFLAIEQIVRLFMFFLIVFCFYGNIKGEKQIRHYLLAMFIVSLLYIYLIFDELRKNNFNPIDMQLNEIIRGSSFINLNSMGAFFIITASILLALSFNKDIRYRMALKVIFYLNCCGLILINSRGALFAFLFCISIVLFHFNKKILIKMVLGFLVLVPMLFIGPINKYVILFFRLNPQILTGRDLIFENSIAVIKANWILGAGPAGTKFEMYKYLPFMLGSPHELFIRRHYEMIQYGHAHNFYLFFFSDLGLPGLFVSIFLLYVFYKIAFKVLAKYKNCQEKYLIVGIIAAGSGLFIRGLFEWGNLISYGQITTDLPFWIIFSILCFYYSKLQDSGNDILFPNK